MFERVSGPVEQAIRKAKINPEDIGQVEILGGGIRVPKTQDILKQVAKVDMLNVHLNGDESMAFGAAFIAANSSSSYKVRKVFLTQHPEFEVKVRISPLNYTAESESQSESEEGINYNREVVLYKQSDYLGQKKTVNLNYDKGMKVECFKVTPQDEGEAIEELLVTYDLDEVEKYATNEIALKANSTTPKVSLSFELSRSQFIKLKQVQVKIDETVVEEIKPPAKEKVVPPEAEKVVPPEPEKPKFEIDPEWDGRQMEVPLEPEEN